MLPDTKKVYYNFGVGAQRTSLTNYHLTMAISGIKIWLFQKIQKVKHSFNLMKNLVSTNNSNTGWTPNNVGKCFYGQEFDNASTNFKSNDIPFFLWTTIIDFSNKINVLYVRFHYSSDILDTIFSCLLPDEIGCSLENDVVCYNQTRKMQVLDHVLRNSHPANRTVLLCIWHPKF